MWVLPARPAQLKDVNPELLHEVVGGYHFDFYLAYFPRICSDGKAGEEIRRMQR